MKKADRFAELIATYHKHGWELRRTLMQSSTRLEFSAETAALLGLTQIKEGPVDALWFARPSHNDREAWELRLVAETQYALFETFEADETDEQREDVRLEMEALMRDYVLGGRETM